ncbi:tyrosine-type recombinase/integrase [Geodermatophilus sp. SYSU D00700]
MTTVADLMPRALAAISDKSRPTYATGLRLLEQRLGGYDLHAVTLADLELLRDDVRTTVGRRTVQRARSTGRRLRSYDPDVHGRGAAENFVRAVRFFFGYATKAGLLATSPAAGLRPPRRPRAPERPLLPEELADIWQVATTTGADPLLDELLLTFLRHTAARREGCLNLTLDHLDAEHGRVTLSEKGGEVRVLPLSCALLTALSEFAVSRGARGPGDPVFRYRSGRPITRRHFNALFDRIDRHLPWTEALDVATHWIRHTTLADVAAVSDVRVATAYAGHRAEAIGVIGRYTQVTFDDLVSAYEQLFGPRG